MEIGSKRHMARGTRTRQDVKDRSLGVHEALQLLKRVLDIRRTRGHYLAPIDCLQENAFDVMFAALK